MEGTHQGRHERGNVEPEPLDDRDKLIGEAAVGLEHVPVHRHEEFHSGRRGEQRGLPVVHVADDVVGLPGEVAAVDR